jgi:hypothetical protein
MEWIEQEEKKISCELRKKTKSNHKEDRYMLIKILLMVSLLSISYAYSEIISCPNCQTKLEMKGVWGHTWICPNPDCLYENYEGIDYCGLCGTYRYNKCQ